MPVLTVLRGNAASTIPFTGPIQLKTLLEQNGILFSHPCGGFGTCRKCRIRIRGQISSPTPAEKEAGCRLSCQVRLLGDATVILPNSYETEEVTGLGEANADISLGVAVDLGTTTLALRIVDLESGNVIGEASERNPQITVAADVMGRIDAAMHGSAGILRDQILEALRSMLDAAMPNQCSESQIRQYVVAGNTAMLLLLTGLDVSGLAAAPYVPGSLFGRVYPVSGHSVYLPPCLSAFVGADITCGILASGMTDSPEPSLLVDIGTNGEIALWKDGTIYVASASAGPAFEGAGISCGCGYRPGVVDYVDWDGLSLQVGTAGATEASGICGSGLVDAVAAFLAMGSLESSGRIVNGEALHVADNVELTQKDIRAIQLAKAAIAAGIHSVFEEAEVTWDEISRVYLAGAFGNRIRIESAVAIGLFPDSVAGRITPLGNASLEGATNLLLQRGAVFEAERIASLVHTVELGGSDVFFRHFMQQIQFPERTE